MDKQKQHHLQEYLPSVDKVKKSGEGEYCLVCDFCLSLDGHGFEDRVALYRLHFELYKKLYDKQVITLACYKKVCMMDMKMYGVGEALADAEENSDNQASLKQLMSDINSYWEKIKNDLE